MSITTENNKRIAKNTLFLYFRSILLILISLYTSRVILEVLGVDDYGIYNLVGGVVGMFSMLSGSMAAASQRFITYALGEDNNNVKIIFSTSITIHFLLGIILAMVLEIVGIYFIYNGLNIPTNRMIAATWALHCSVFTFFINVISIPYNALIIAHERMGAFAYISILDAVLKLVVVFILMIISVDKLIVYALLVSLIAFIQRLVYSFYCRRNFCEAQNISFKIDKDCFNKMFAFAGWSLWGNGSLVLRNQGIDILLNVFFGVTINAAKGICNQVQSAIYQFVTNFQTALIPQLTKSIAQRDYGRACELIFKGSRFSFYLLCVFSVPLLITTPQVLSIWLVEVPGYTVEFVRLTIFYLLLDCLSRCLINAIQAEGNIKKYKLVVGGTKILTLPLAYCLLLFGCNPMTGIWANIMIEIVCLIQRLYFTKQRIGLSSMMYLKNVVLSCCGIFITAAIASVMFSMFVTNNLLTTLLVSFLLSVFIIYWIGLTPSEKDFIHQRARLYLLRIKNE